jgi:hypothetical protein
MTESHRRSAVPWPGTICCTLSFTVPASLHLSNPPFPLFLSILTPSLKRSGPDRNQNTCHHSSPPSPPPLPSPTRFLFANHDGVTVELSVSPTTRVADIKHRLREVWPPALLVAERRRISGSNTSSSTHAPNSLQPRHHHHHTYDDHEEGLSESEDEDEDEEDGDEDEEEDEDDGTVASCSGAGPPPLRLRAPGVDRLRLICMGQGLLLDSRTLHGRLLVCLGVKREGRREGGGGYVLLRPCSKHCFLFCVHAFDSNFPRLPAIPSAHPHCSELTFHSPCSSSLPHTATQTECRIPVFSHPTPVNVSICPPPPRPPGQGKKGQQKKKKKTLDDEEGAREGVGVVVPRGCVSCSIM